MTTAAALLAPIVGCRVTAETAGGATLACPDGWAAARLLAALVPFDAQLPAIRLLAARLWQATAPSTEAYARAVHAWVCQNVPFFTERVETFIRPDLLAVGAYTGDCDDHARLVAALLEAGGVRSRLVVLARSTPSHVTAQAWIGLGGWVWLETTVRAAFGEHPYRAAVRLGVTRRDISDAPEEHIMPTPTREQITAWQIQLQKLGYYMGPIDGRRDTELTKQAVRGFQLNANREGAAGLTVDGLLGPLTGAALAKVAVAPTDPAPALGTVAEPTEATYSGLPKGIDRRFCEALRAQCEEHGCSAETALQVFEHESGINTTGYVEIKTANNTTTRGGGLNMFIRPPTGFGGTVADFARLHPADQLPFIFQFWKPLKGIDDPVTYLQYNFLPASLARGRGSDDVVVCAKGGTGYGGNEDFFYHSNAGMDLDKNGTITRGDLRRSLRKGAVYQRVLAAYKATPERKDTSIPAVVALPAVAVGVFKLATYLVHFI